MRQWAAGVLARHSGRVAAVAIGLGMLSGGAFLGFLGKDSAVATALVFGGLVLCALGCLVLYLKTFKAGGVEAETRDPAGLQLAQEVAHARETNADPESIDLAGEDAWEGARFRLGERALEYLLSDLHDHLYGCEARIFLFDAVEQKLVPAYRPAEATGPPIAWAPGVGVTGVAFREERYVFAEGDRTHDGTYGLTPELQERFANLTAVAAVPLFDREDKVLGTLSLSSRSPATKLTTDHGYAQHVALAQQVAVTLVDLLRVTA